MTTRKQALKCLMEIWFKGLKPKKAVENLASDLPERERPFLRELVYGVLRNRDLIDCILDELLRKPSGISPLTRENLRLGAYQILFMRVPGRAAVHEAVEIEKQHGNPGVVNAVLRNLLRNPGILDSVLLRAQRKGIVPFIAVLTSHPEWIIRRWVDRLGADEAQRFAEANNRLAPFTIRVNVSSLTREDFMGKLSHSRIQAVMTPYAPEGLVLSSFSSFRELSPWKAHFMVQDEAAQLISHLLAPEPGERILDACAAPGGKATHIAQLIRDQGTIIALEPGAERLTLLRENISRFGLSSIAVLQEDILNYEPDRPFDKVLLDAPCSSLGVIRRNPDIKYRRRPEDIEKFSRQQLLFLRRVSHFVRPGGHLVYSVCSTEPEEGEEVIKEFLKEFDDFYIIQQSMVPFLKELTDNGFLRTYPQIQNMDGFFGVRLCRRD